MGWTVISGPEGRGNRSGKRTFRFEEGKHLPCGALVGDKDAVLLETQAGDDGLGLGFAESDKIEFLPYWRAAECGLSFDEKKKIYCSAWLDRAGRRALVVVTNWKDAQKAKVALDFGKLGVDPKAEAFASFNVAGMKPTDVIPMKGGAFEVDVARHSYVLVTVEKREKAK